MSSAKPIAAQRFDGSQPIETARTPPASWYVSEAHDRLERAHILAQNWQVVAHGDEVFQPGNFVAGCIGSEPWVLVRDTQNALHGLANVCRHNGTQVAQGRGQIRQFTCPYHGWCYHLDGRLKKAPRMAGIDNFDRQQFGLTPLGVRVFGPLIFINATADAAPLDLGELGERLAGANWTSLKRHTRRSYELGCNWKVFVDNYLDGGYHVPLLHADLASGLDLDAYRTEIFERYSIQTVPAAKDAGKRLGAEGIYAWVYPNLMINHYGPMMDINVVVPTGPMSCRVDFDWYFEKDCSEQFIAESITASEQVQREDIAICESLQTGMGSMHFRPGPYAPQVEMGKHHFHRLLAQDLLAAEA